MPRILPILILIICVAMGCWLTCALVGSDGALHGWSSADGTLMVPAKGLRWLPRWGYRRLVGQKISGEFDAVTEEGVRIDVRVAFEPTVGRWKLSPADSPSEGFVKAARLPSREYLATVPLSCLVSAGNAAYCPSDPGVRLRALLSESLDLPLGRLEARPEPDPEVVRTFLLDSIRKNLPDVRRKLLVIGLDGVDWEIALPYVEQGLMPNLARLMGMGTWGEMETLVPMLSPLIWTTMATGVSPDEHGILDFVQRDPETGDILPITSNLRQVPAIWNLASALGKTTDVIAWWATWPAERLNGVMVSDRLYFSLTQGLAAEAYTAERPEVISPADREQEFRDLRARAVDETDWKAVRYFINISEEDYLAEIEGGEGWENPIDGFRRTLIATRLYFGSALLLAEDQPDLLMVYIEGTDEIGHIMAPFVPPPTLDVPPQRAAVLAASVPRYFRAVDRWIGRLLETCSPKEYTVFVVSDHGFRWGDDRPKGLSGTSGPTAALWHKQPAIYLIAGKDAGRLGRVTEWKSVFDVAPTVAAILGIPPDVGWPGAPLPGSPASDLAPIQYSPLVPPSSYQTSSGGRTQADPELIAKLKALGYLSGGDDTPLISAGEVTPIPARVAAKPTATPLRVDDPQKVTAGQINNLAVIKINQKKYDEAIELLNQLIALRPQAAGPHFNLRRIYMETGRYDEADRELWEAIDRGFRDSERTLDRAAADYEVMEMPERADVLLIRAIETFPDHEPFYVHLMVTRVREGRFTEALPIGEVAVEKFPESGPVHAFYGLAAASAGLVELARRELTLSLEINPEQPVLRQALAELGPAVSN